MYKISVFGGLYEDTDRVVRDKHGSGKPEVGGGYIPKPGPAPAKAAPHAAPPAEHPLSPTKPAIPEAPHVHTNGKWSDTIPARMTRTTISIIHGNTGASRAASAVAMSGGWQAAARDASGSVVPTLVVIWEVGGFQRRWNLKSVRRPQLDLAPARSEPAPRSGDRKQDAG